MTFQEIVQLVDNLTPIEQTELISHLLEATKKRELSVQEKMKLLRSAQIDVEVVQEPSIRRQDWYDDDGR